MSNTITTPPTSIPVSGPAVDPTSTHRPAWQRIGGLAGLVAAATFIFGIALFFTSMSDHTTGDPTPAESVEFVVDHQGTFFVWYLVIYIVFGVAVVPMTLALRNRLRAGAPQLTDAGAVFGLIWAVLMFATGMVSNIGIEVVADLAENQPDLAPAVWSSIDAVTNGLGGGNELVGALWILLVSAAAWSSRALPRTLNVIGLVSSVAGLATLIPGFEAIEMVFGLGSIVWLAGVGVALLRDAKPGAGAVGGPTMPA